jgi:hypothetical protein
MGYGCGTDHSMWNRLTCRWEWQGHQ